MLRCTPIQIIGGDADVDHSQTIGGDTAKLLADISPPPPPPPPPPPGFRHPCFCVIHFLNIFRIEDY